MFNLAAICQQTIEQFGADLAGDEKQGLQTRARSFTALRGASCSRGGPPSPRLPVHRAAWFQDCVRMGQIARGLGRSDEAISLVPRSAGLLGGIHPSNAPIDPGERERYWAVHWELANLRQAVGRPADAIPNYLVWRDLRAADFRASPTDPVAVKRLADACFRLGLARRDSGQADQALQDLEQARKLLESLTQDLSPTRLQELVRINRAIGRILDRQGRFAQAIEPFTRTKALIRSAWAPTDPRRRRGWRVVTSVIGNLRCDLHQFSAAVTSFRRALELEESLVRDYPNNGKYRSDMDGTKQRLAQTEEILNRP